ncbi:serine hydrolase [Sphingomonas sp. LHG3406-1]|uniref:serine hydrolase domain-containing protein n=1 Tax=Sphingomonas sp. LHG3406-1 TaxID=2804617 RepID=UPI00260234C7|nr:serine hydrolase [Sphingomonas sp. LHG3406-1]
MRPFSLAASVALLAGCAPLERPAGFSPPPDVAYAWVRFTPTKVPASGAAGLADRAAGRTITIDDPIRVASVSKIVTALTVMRLVDEGRLSLDEDVSARLGYALRNPHFPDKPITLRMLLSQTSSVRDQGENYVIRFGEAIRPRIEAADSFDPDHPPGTFFRYANLNSGIVATLLEKVTGERFDRLSHRLVLQPLGLAACFNWTMCSDAAVARAVTLYDEDGSVVLDDLKGRRPACPVFTAPGVECDLDAYELGTNGALFSPQGGLRISAEGLTVIGQMLMNGGTHRGSVFLKPGTVRQMTSPQWRFDGRNGATESGFYCRYGLGIQLLPGSDPACRDRLLADGRAMFGHAGEAYRVRSGLWIDSIRREGIAYVAANNGKDPPRGRTEYRAIEEWLAARLR